MIRGLIGGTIGLALLEALVSSSKAAGNAGTLLTAVANVLSRWVDPTVPLVPNLTGAPPSPGLMTSTQSTGYTPPPSTTAAEPVSYIPAAGTTAATVAAGRAVAV